MYTHDQQHRIFLKMNCIGFANVMNNMAIINIFNNDNSNVTYMKLQHHEIMTTTLYRFLKFEFVIKNLIMPNHTFFTVVTVSKINFLDLVNFATVQNL